MSVSAAVKRSRGRPAIGERIIVTLTPEQRALAEQLGGGVIGRGVRRALDLAAGAVPSPAGAGARRRPPP